jgi:uncharacterized membrane protein YeaQ/YmgE (transglycosylase-associated protein family)
MSSCSTLKKTIIYSSLTGAAVGSVSGVVLSPDKQSQSFNAAVFGIIGAAVAGLTGYALYKDDPRNYKLKQMLLPKKKIDTSRVEINLGNFMIDAKLDKKEKYKVPLKKLPKALQGKVNKQFLIKYQSKERYVKKGNKTFYIPAFDIYEHGYSDTPDTKELEVESEQ